MSRYLLRAVLVVCRPGHQTTYPRHSRWASLEHIQSPVHSVIHALFARTALVIVEYYDLMECDAV